MSTIKKIKHICKKTDFGACFNCQLCDKFSGKCLLNNKPRDWDISKIKEILKLIEEDE